MYVPTISPSNLNELEKWYGSDQACRKYLEAVRWPNGFECPKCGANRHWNIGKRGVKECAECHHQTSVTVGTIFEGTRKPLALWLLAMWFFVTEEWGINARVLQKKLGFSRYETAWTWLYKLRHAMVCPNRDRLHGTVELFLIHLGNWYEISSDETARRQSVLIAIEVGENSMGCVRVQKLTNFSYANLTTFVQNAISIGSLIQTYEWEGRLNLERVGYIHQDLGSINKRNQSGNRPDIYQVAIFLDKWLQSKLRSGAGKKHLDYYLDEFTFRSNHRKLKCHAELFYCFVQRAVQVDPITWGKVIGHK